MIFHKTEITGAYLIDLEKREDDRGFLARTFSKKEFADIGLDIHFQQGYMTYTKRKSTMRGLHYQVMPFEEYKLIRCTKGSIFEVVIDLRPGSATYKKWLGFSLKASDYKMLLIPPYFAHGILNLEDKTEVMNFTTNEYSSRYEKGIRYNDSAFNIKWPINIDYVSKKDMAWEDFPTTPRLRGASKL